MKYILILLVISGFSYAQEENKDRIKIEKVRSVDYGPEEATVTFWGTNQVYRLPLNDKVMPCLDNGWKSELEVALKMKGDSDAIVGCRLYNGGIPIFK